MRRGTAGGTPELVLVEPATKALGVWCAMKPNSSCVLGQKEEKNLVFYAFDPVRGKGEQLGKIEVSEYFNWSLSPDGSRVALVDVATYPGRLEVLPLSDHIWQGISVESGWGDLQEVAWAAEGKGFFASSNQSGSFSLLFITPAGQVKPILKRGSRGWINSPLPSPDGKYLAYSGVTIDANVWMVEGF
jgi:Tol biopolymer transport system component